MVVVTVVVVFVLVVLVTIHQVMMCCLLTVVRIHQVLMIDLYENTRKSVMQGVTFYCGPSYLVLSILACSFQTRVLHDR